MLVTTGAISGVTLATRLRGVSVGSLAATPRAIGQGRVWLLASSALVADRPALPSLAGFLLVGLVTQAVCGRSVVWLAAAAGHIGSAVAVYLAIGLTRLVAPTAFEHVLSLRDYGTSAIIAAWIGALSYRWWTRGGALGDRGGVVCLCTISGVVGWLLHPDLTPLDSEHAVALCLGAAAAWYAPRLVPSVRYERLKRRLGRRAVAAQIS